MDAYSERDGSLLRLRTSVHPDTFNRVDIVNELAMLRDRRECELGALDAEIAEKELLLKKCDELGIK